MSLKSGAPIWVPHVGDRSPSTLDLPLLPSQAFLQELYQKWSNQDQYQQFHMGFQHRRLNLLSITLASIINLFVNSYMKYVCKHMAVSI